MGNFFTVLEIQVTAESAMICTPTIYTSYEEALSKFFTVCHAATQSGLPYHAAFILQDDGMMVKSEIFDRRVVE